MRFSNIQIVIVLTVLGTLIRWIYGLYFEAWNQAPDHIAWELVLREGSWNYAQLIHYPHEGGSILVSLISRCIGFFTSYDSLAISALILDSISRFVQLWVVSKVFSRKVFWGFGAWTLLATPFLLMWGMVNFGLHNTSSVFPFIFLYLLGLPQSQKNQWLLGIFLGIAIWFSYTNLILLPIYLIYQFIASSKKQSVLHTILAFMVVFGIHVLIRLNFDPGFHLSNYGMTSIRGIDFLSFSSVHVQHLLGTWIKAIPQFAVGNTTTHFALIPTVIIWFILFILSLKGIYTSFQNRKFSKSVYYAFLTIPVFLIAYGLSPFYYGNIQNGNFTTYRHLTYIFPILSMMIIVGLSELKYQKTLIMTYLFVPVVTAGISVINPIHNSQSRTSTLKSAGWVIGYKFGHDPSKLQSIISDSENYDLLLEGTGWGACTALFEKPTTSAEEMSNKINLLLRINDQFKPSEQIIFLQGVKYAFSPKVNPQLPQETLHQILEKTAP